MQEVLPVNLEYAKKQGLRVSELRKAKGYTQEQLAAKLQIMGCDYMTRSALAKVEVGQRSLYPDEIKALKEILNAAYEDLFV